MYYAYIIKSRNGKIYTGHTSDINRRLKEHNSGRCKTTKTDQNWRLIYREEFPDRREAIRREKWLKSGIGRDFVKNMLLSKK